VRLVSYDYVALADLSGNQSAVAASLCEA